jgi:hypothetical protein
VILIDDVDRQDKKNLFSKKHRLAYIPDFYG